MPWEPIVKSSPRGRVAQNLLNYEQARATFSLESVKT
jgi:hypothetical protein